MFKKTSIIVRHQFPGIHNWKDCNIDQVGFLQNPHRHMFFVEAVFSVTHGDRDMEFFMVKRDIGNTIKDLYNTDDIGNHLLGSRSCEMIAREIIETAVGYDCPSKSITVRVFEDNENGAEVVWEAP